MSKLSKNDELLSGTFDGENPDWRTWTEPVQLARMRAHLTTTIREHPELAEKPLTLDRAERLIKYLRDKK